MLLEVAMLTNGLERIRREWATLRYDVAFRKLMLTLKAGFRPDQARDDQGRWTDEGEEDRRSAEAGAQLGEDVALAASGEVFSIFADLDSVPLADRIAQLAGHEADDDASLTKPAGATVSYSNAVTGNERIDITTERLTNTLKMVMTTFDFIPYSAPNLYGTAIHTAFGLAVRAQAIDGIEVELSYRDTKEVTYGTEGSVRADVALHSTGGEVIAIYDLKTGGAVVSSSRADELRNHFTAPRYVPVIELHVLRGSRIKHATLSAYFQSNSKTGSRVGPVW